MIRTAKTADTEKLKELYRGSVYEGLPELVKWALLNDPDRVLLDEKRGTLLVAVYTMVCGYNNLWASYLCFEEEVAAKLLVEHLLAVRKERRARNLYVFCPKEFVETRVGLISLGFVPEWAGKIDGLDYVIEVHDGLFNPDYQVPCSEGKISMQLDRGCKNDLRTLSRILHESLPKDFGTMEKAASCVRRWLSEMPEDTVVARYSDLPVGVLLLSQEIYPVLDRELAMLCYIAVDKRYRHKGVGKALVNEACNVLRRRGKRGIEVDVSVHNLPARIFYTRTGFVPYWYSKRYMQHDDGIFYRKEF